MFEELIRKFDIPSSHKLSVVDRNEINRSVSSREVAIIEETGEDGQVIHRYKETSYIDASGCNTIYEIIP